LQYLGYGVEISIKNSHSTIYPCVLTCLVALKTKTKKKIIENLKLLK